MHYIKKIAILISVRGLSLIGFFLLAFAMDGNSFKEYTLYFSTWQIISQITGLQLGSTLFRYGATPNFHKEAFYISKILAQATPIVFVIFLLSAVGNTPPIVTCIGMSLIYALFSCTVEFARASTSENKIFALQSIIGLSYLSIFIISQTLNNKIKFNTVIIVEGAAHFIVTILIFWKIKNNQPETPRTSEKNIFKKLIPLWKTTSLPLIPNNIIWYIYFNSPQIISYFIQSEISEHNNRSILFRLIVASSTLSSILSIGLQKGLVNLYEDNMTAYEKKKYRVLKIDLPLTFITLLIYTQLVNKVYLWLKTEPTELYIYVSSYITSISTLTTIFLAIYVTSNFILSEKKNDHSNKIHVAWPSRVYFILINYIKASARGVINYIWTHSKSVSHAIREIFLSSNQAE
ncbi:hypothetical protein [Pseudomonas nitroreducens]|uniref:hypothetical protein n=1 Tax=Pseudomonas nitroreducens TaxID=46680 RepID=UPI000FE13F7F|nr:hypothetical protein [Pseudomonas nitroreducens]